MKGGHRAAMLGLLVMIPVVLATTAGADRAGIPIDRDVEFDESAQNAIAAWNGEQECLILSTDLQSPSPGRLMEMLPLPSAPYDIRAASTSSFTTLIKLYNEKMKRLDANPASMNGERGLASGGDALQEFEGIDIVFSSSVGLHNITVVKLESTDHFLQWARGFAQAQGVSGLAIDERINQSVGDHLQRGISYFVFDIVSVTGEKRTAEPLSYFFNTSYLYYPLRITYDSLPEGSSRGNDISVFLVADGVVREPTSYSSGVYFTGGVDEYLEFSRSELGRVFGPLGDLFDRSAFVAHLAGRMYSYDHSPDSVKDVVLRTGDFRRPTDAEMRALYERADYLRTIKPLSPSLAYYMLRSVYEPGFAPPGPFLAMILLGIFLGPAALGLMYMSMMNRRDPRNGLWVAWLTMYCVGAAGILFITTVVTYYSGNEAWLLVVYLALFLPLLLLLYLGERFKTRPASGQNTVRAAAFGMALAQVLVFVFVPNSTVAIPIDIVCFPSLGIAGLVVLPLFLLMRRRTPPRPGLTPQQPSGPRPPPV